jgi:hypothetical protein
MRGEIRRIMTWRTLPAISLAVIGGNTYIRTYGLPSPDFALSPAGEHAWRFDHLGKVDTTISQGEPCECRFIDRTGKPAQKRFRFAKPSSDALAPVVNAFGV